MRRFLGVLLILPFAVVAQESVPEHPPEAAPLPTPRGFAQALAEEVRTVFQRTREAVVKIHATDKNGELCGTGFFIDPNGTILTSYSVGGDSREIVVFQGQAKHRARRLIADLRSGIALLQLEESPQTPTPFLPMGRSAELSVATPVLLVAYPMDMPVAPSFGLVAGFDRKYLNRYFATTHIRANVAVQRGEGGAPLLNMRGEVIGVVTSGLDGGASCFALPIEAASKVHRDYQRFGALRPGWLGIMVGRTAETAPHGSAAQIEGVEEDGPAVHAGLQKDDILLKIGPNEIRAPEDVLNAAFYLTAGDVVRVTVWREGTPLELELTPGERAPTGLAAPGRPKLGDFSFKGEDITLRGTHP